MRRDVQRDSQRRRRTRSQVIYLTNICRVNDLMTTQLNEAIMFDRGVSEIIYVCCNTCHRAFPDIIFINTELCQTCKSSDCALKFFGANSMNSGPVSDSLRATLKK